MRTSHIHYIDPSAISITPNCNNSFNDLAVYIAPNTKIKVYCKKAGLDTINGDFQEWSIKGRNRRLADSSKPYTIYARLSKTNKNDGYIVFVPMNLVSGEWMDKYNYVADNDKGRTTITGATTPSDYWYFKLGDVSLPENELRTVTFDTGIVGTEQFNTEWALNPDSLPLRIELSCTVNDEDAGPTPYVYWGQTLVLSAILTEGWTGTDIQRFDHWEIARDSGSAQADEDWAAAINADSGDDSFWKTGDIELQHGRGAGQGIRDDFNSAVNTTFIINAMERTDDPEQGGTPEYAVLKTISICIMAETWEKYELSPSSAMVTYNPITGTYSPGNGVTFNVRATDQKSEVFLMTNKQVTDAGLVAEYAAVGVVPEVWTAVTISGPDSNVAIGTISAAVFTQQKSVNVRLRNAANTELHRFTIAFLRDGEDSKEREWIFLRSTEAITFGDASSAHPKPSLISGGQVNPTGAATGSDTNKNQDGWVPEGWWDEQQGVTDTYLYEYGSYRNFVKESGGVAAHWGAFTTPKIWNHYGTDGDDGLYYVDDYGRASSRNLVSGLPEGFDSTTGWQSAAPAATDTYKYIWKRSRQYNPNTQTYGAATYVCLTGADGTTGARGGNTATVMLYKRSSSAVTSVGINTTLYYKFSTKKLYTDAACTTEATTQLNGWSLTIPHDSANPIYVTAAIAYSNTESDDITSNEWVAPAQYTENGEPGGHGINSATVFLYKRNASAISAHGITTALYYKFSDGKLYTKSGSTYTEATDASLNNWKREIPASDGNPCYVIQAAALSTEEYDQIATTDWSGVRKLVEDGNNGNDAQYIYLMGTARDEDSSKTTTIPCVVNVNGGTNLATGNRGLNLVTINRQTLAVVESINYDTYGQVAETGTGIDDLIAKLNTLDNSVFVCLVSWDAIGWNSSLITTLQGYGMSDLPYTETGRYPFLFIGYKGLGKGNGLMRMHDIGAYTDVVELSVYVANGALSSHDGQDGVDGEPGEDAVNVVVSPASMIVEQDINNKNNIQPGADTNLGQFSIQVLKGIATACNITSITAVPSHVSISEFNNGYYYDSSHTWTPSTPQVANMYLRGIGSDSSGYYTTGQITLSITYTDPDTGDSKIISNIIARVYVNLIGSWSEEVVGDAKTEVAKSLSYAYDPTGQTVISLEQQGQYIKSSTENISTLTKKINNGKNLLTGVLTGANWKSSTSKSTSTSSLHNVTLDDDSYFNAAENDTMIIKASQSIQRGQDYTVSFETPSGQASGVGINWYIRSSEGSGDDLASGVMIPAGNVKRSFTFNISGTGSLSIRICIGTAILRYPQMETGDTATAFEASSTETTSQIKQTADEIDFSIRDDLETTGINISTGKVAVEADNFTVGKNGETVFGVDSTTGVTTMQDVDIKGSLLFHKTYIDKSGNYIKMFSMYNEYGNTVGYDYSGEVKKVVMDFDTLVIGGSERTGNYILFNGSGPNTNIIESGYTVLLPPAKLFPGMRLKIINGTVTGTPKTQKPSKINFAVVYRSDMDQYVDDTSGYATNLLATVMPIKVNKYSNLVTFVGAPDKQTCVTDYTPDTAEYFTCLGLSGDDSGSPVRYERFELVSQENPYTSSGYAWIIIDSDEH